MKGGREGVRTVLACLTCGMLAAETLATELEREELAEDVSEE